MAGKIFDGTKVPYVLAITVALLTSVESRAEELGDPKIGRTFALNHCSECHAVNENEVVSPNAGAPSFTSVASTSGMTGLALSAWLDTSHPTMPNLVLSKQDRDDVIAYIISLKRKTPQ
ncbi:c-type cytochrome [Hyphomicrobium sp. 99]|uniref:c-type cytochrome n=1 Tax=Hyphomicrobium sp. 99 TaxID=1163419 RepID=UPI000699240D|nr:c-type cytochrome [Hyphomicrobium sp. 99]